MTLAEFALPRLGKKAAVYDPRTLKLSNYLDLAALPTPPASTHRSEAVTSWPMFLNDQLGDCTIAALAHMIGFWLSLSKDKIYTLSDANVLAAYRAVTGYNPADPSTDTGAVELDVLRYWSRHGVAGHHAKAFAAVNITNRAHVETAAWLFDGLYIGVALPATAQGQSSWEFHPKQGSAAYPGSWGGHAVNVVDYDTSGVTVITWGRPLHMSWDFWAHYVDEAYAIIAVEEFNTAGKTVEGFNIAALTADLASIHG